MADKTNEELNAAAVKAAKDSFDFAKDARAAMTTDAYSDFVGAVKDQLDINITDPLDINEYVAIAEIYNQFAVDDLNLKDQFRDDVYKSALDIFLSEAIDIKSLLAGLEEDPDKRNIMLGQLVETLVAMNQRAAIVSDFGRLPTDGEAFTPPQ